MIEVRVSGVAGSVNLADELEKDFRKRARGAVLEAGRLLQKEVRLQLKRHAGPDASPEGEPPAYQSGELYDSIKVLPVRVRGTSVSSGVSSDHPGAFALEYGQTAATAEKIAADLRQQDRESGRFWGPSRQRLRSSRLRRIRQLAQTMAKPVVQRAPRPYFRPAQAAAAPKVDALLRERLL